MKNLVIVLRVDGIGRGGADEAKAWHWWVSWRQGIRDRVNRAKSAPNSGGGDRSVGPRMQGRGERRRAQHSDSGHVPSLPALHGSASLADPNSVVHGNRLEPRG